MHTLVIGSNETNRAGFIDRLLTACGPRLRLYGYRSVKEVADETGNAPIYLYPASGKRRRTQDTLLGWCRNRQSTANLEAFDRNAFLIESAGPDGLLVMDEIGPMESRAPRFRAAVLAAMEREAPILASVRDIEIPFLETVRAHPNARCFYLTCENGEALFSQVLAHLQKQLDGVS